MKSEIKERIEQIQRGEVPEGYKKTKLGILPNDWTSTTLGECLEKVEKPVAMEPDKLYTQIGIRSHGKGLFYKEPVTGESLGNKSVYWIEPDCFILNIVFAWEQAIGKTTHSEEGMIGSHRFPMYRPVNNLVDIDYLICYLLTKRGTSILDAASPGGAGRNRTLGQDRFMKSKIVLPPLAEQKKIAEILAAQDKVIELKEKLLEEKKKQKKYLMQQLLTGKKRLPGFSGEWCKKALGDILVEGSKEPVNTDDFKKITVKLNFNGIEFANINRDMVDTRPFYIRKKNEIIIGKQNYFNGSVALVTEEFDGCICSNAIMSFSVNNENEKFVLSYISQLDFMKKHEMLANGTGQKELSEKDFLNFEIDLPNNNEQNAISDVLSSADKEISIIKESINHEVLKKKALMQLLLTGIVRVNV